MDGTQAITISWMNLFTNRLFGANGSLFTYYVLKKIKKSQIQMHIYIVKNKKNIILQKIIAD